MIEGREFTWSDTGDQLSVAVINRAMASRMFPGRHAVGSRVEPVGAPAIMTFTIVGVIGNSSTGDVRFREFPVLYAPLLQDPRRMTAPNVIIRHRADAGLDEAVRGALEPLGRHRVMGLQTIEDQANRVHMRERVLTGISAAFAAISLLVGSLGLYALLTQAVIGRTREWGVRRALGATESAVVAMVLREGMILVAAGLGLGLPAALGAAAFAQALLSDFSAHDPVSYVSSVVLVLAVGVIASGWPAVRASRMAPAEALRQE